MFLNLSCVLKQLPLHQQANLNNLCVSSSQRKHRNNDLKGYLSAAKRVPEGKGSRYFKWKNNYWLSQKVYSRLLDVEFFSAMFSDDRECIKTLGCERWAHFILWWPSPLFGYANVHLSRELKIFKSTALRYRALKQCSCHTVLPV